LKAANLGPAENHQSMMNKFILQQIISNEDLYVCLYRYIMINII